MTDYNDGKWHGWNGGACPVHPQSVVNVVWADDRNPNPPTQYPARAIAWNSKIGDAPVAFRVVAEYREPREWWICGNYVYASAREAKTASPGSAPIHVREVQS